LLQELIYKILILARVAGQAAVVAKVGARVQVLLPHLKALTTPVVVVVVVEVVLLEQMAATELLLFVIKHLLSVPCSYNQVHG
jgi:hypothetical protein